MSLGDAIGRIHSVETFGALDGPGIRYVLFLQGCPLRCAYCHNPDTWEMSGKTVKTAAQVVEDILRYSHFIAAGGVTLSGGEPLLQADFCREVIELCHQHGLHCAIDTSGALPLSQCQTAVNAADMLLLDIKALDPQVYRKLTGSDNRNALALLNYCELIGKMVWIRHVLVPGVTLIPERLEALAEFLRGYACVARVELLPFHKMGEYKWEAMHMKSPLAGTNAPTEEEVAMAKNIFSSKGLPL